MSNGLTGAVACGAVVAVLLLGFALRETAVVRRLRLKTITERSRPRT